MVDDVCLNAVRGISDLIIAPGLINVDFADVRTIMTGMGRALMGTGYGTGDKRAMEAAQQAISSPLLEDVSINGATGILLNITGGPDLTLAEVNEACSLIQEAARRRRQHHLRFGHRRARRRPGAHHRHRHRLQLAAAEQPMPNVGGRTHGHGHGRNRDDQMALPMQSARGTDPGMVQAAPAMATTTARGGYGAPGAVPQARAELSPEAINLDDFYSSVETVPPAALGATPASMAQQPGAEWIPAERPSSERSREAAVRRSFGARRRKCPLVRPLTSSGSRSRNSTSRPTCDAGCSRPSSAATPQRGMRGVDNRACRLESFFAKSLELVWPATCASCERPVAEQVLFCAGCNLSINPLVVRAAGARCRAGDSPASGTDGRRAAGAADASPSPTPPRRLASSMGRRWRRQSFA